MSHHYSKVWIHLVFGTKYRLPLITSEIESEVYDFIRAKLQEMKCIPIAVNGMEDHAHVLFGLNPEKSISDVTRILKGGCSHWVNLEGLSEDGLKWQTGHGAFSVSDSELHKVKAYVDNQKSHHNNGTLIPELEKWDNLAEKAG